MKDFGNSFSRGIRIRAAGFVLFCSRVFLRSSGGLGVQAASGAGWERAARSHGGVENTTLRSFRSDPALEWSHFVNNVVCCFGFFLSRTNASRAMAASSRASDIFGSSSKSPHRKSFSNHTHFGPVPTCLRNPETLLWNDAMPLH